MLGSTHLTLVMGAAPSNTAPTPALKSYVRALADAGLSVLFIQPGTKIPDDLRSAQARKKAADAGDDRAGLYLATKDKVTLARYVEAARKKYGDDAALNLAIHAGRSRYVIIDADTPEEVDSWRAWWSQAAGQDMAGVPPTVTTPGAQDKDGAWKHQGGGHWYLRLPDGFDLPEGTPAKIKVGQATAYVGDCYVLIPPSTRPEGRYEMTGTDYDTPQALLDLLVPPERTAKKKDAPTSTTPPPAPQKATQAAEGQVSLEEWLNDTPWGDVLGDGWEVTGTDKCGCAQWRAPGLHDSPKSAVTHEGCGDHTDGGRLHVWSDNPQTGTALDDAVAAGVRDFSKLGAIAVLKYGGTDGKKGDPALITAMAALGIDRSTVESGGGLLEAGKGKATEEDDDGWDPVDMSIYLADDYAPPRGGLLLRTDGVGLLYKGMTHSFHGESESGKSLIAQAEAARVLLAGGSVVFIDYESRPDAVGNRFRGFGVPKEILEDPGRFIYVQPAKGPGQKFARLLARTWDMAVIDGVTHSLATMQLGSQGDTDIATWQDALPKPLAKHTGAAVVVVDHVNKSADSRGRFATGSQHKMAGLTGAGYVVEPLDVLKLGVGGRVRMSVAKDRPGGVRCHLGEVNAARMQVAAVVEFDSTGEFTTWRVVPPENDDAPVDPVEKEIAAGELLPLEAAGLDPARGMYVVVAVLAGADGLNQTGAVRHYRNLRRSLNSSEDATAAWKAAEQAGAFRIVYSDAGNTTRYRTADRRHAFATEEPVRRAIRNLEKRLRAGDLSGLRPVSEEAGDDAE